MYKITTLLKTAGLWDCVQLVFYEDLVRETKEVVERIAKFLDVHYEEIYTRPTTLGIPATVRTSSRETQTIFDGWSGAHWTDELKQRESVAMKMFDMALRASKKRAMLSQYRALRDISGCEIEH